MTSIKIFIFILFAVPFFQIKLKGCSEVETAIKLFKCYDKNKENFLGSGATGNVYLMKKSDDNSKGAQFFAVKVQHGNDQILRSAEREAKILFFINSKYVIKVFGSGEIDDNYFTVMEAVGPETIFVALRKNKNYFSDDTQMLTFFFKIVLGVASLHKAGIVHADIKSKNIMMQNEEPKIIDLDLAVQRNESAGPRGTPYYMSSELFGRFRLTFYYTIDMHALGVLLFEMTQKGKFPYTGNSLQELKKDILRGQIFFETKIKTTTAFLIFKLLAPDPASRFTVPEVLMYINEVLSHPCTDNFDGFLDVTQDFRKNKIESIPEAFQQIPPKKNLKIEDFKVLENFAFIPELQQIIDNSQYDVDKNAPMRNMLESIDERQDKKKLKNIKRGFVNMFKKNLKLISDEKEDKI